MTTDKTGTDMVIEWLEGNHPSHAGLIDLIDFEIAKEKQKIAKLEQELCDMTFAYNACSYLLDKINK
jgi:hypothetical protein